MDRFNLGSHSRKISTPSDAAQRWFDTGLNWCFGFNKAEGVKCFRNALEFDPDCPGERCSTTALKASFRWLKRCWMEKWHITKAITKLHLHICARPSKEMTRLNMSSHGLDAPSSTRACGTSRGAGVLRRGGTDLSRRPRTNPRYSTMRAASPKRLGTPRSGGVFAGS